MALKMKITYSTMSADNEELQSAFDAAFAKVRQSMLGLEVPMFIDGEKVYAEEKTRACSPVDTSLHLCTAQKGTAEHARMAVSAARAAAQGMGGHALAGARSDAAQRGADDPRSQL